MSKFGDKRSKSWAEKANIEIMKLKLWDENFELYDEGTKFELSRFQSEIKSQILTLRDKILGLKVNIWRWRLCCEKKSTLWDNSKLGKK